MGEIKIIINKTTGEFSIEGEGYEGNLCVDDINILTELLGAETLSEETKPEYTVRVNTQKIGG